MLRSNSNAFKNKVRKYILDKTEGKFFEYGLEGEYNEKRAAKLLYVAFGSEYNHEYNKRRTPNIQERLCEWLSGLAISIDYCNYNCKNIMADWYEITAAEMQQKINRYWKCNVWQAFLKIISYEIIELWRKYGLCYTDFAFYDWKHFDGMEI